MGNKWEEVMVPNGTGDLTNNATDLPNLYVVDEPKVTGSLFCHRNIHNWIWYTDLQQMRLGGARRSE